jgi:hypothetical protein
MSLDRARETRDSKDSAEVQRLGRTKLPDLLSGASGTPFSRRPLPEFGLGEERQAPSGQFYNWYDHHSGVEYTRQGPAETAEAFERRLIPDALGSLRERAWDVEAGLARLRGRLERLRSDPAEQRRMDELLAEIPPPESFIGMPPAKEALIELPPPSSKAADEFLAEIPPSESLVYNPLVKERLIELRPQLGKAALDRPLDYLRSKDEHGERVVDKILINPTPSKDEHGMNKIRGLNRIRGKDQSGGSGKLSI